MKFIRWLMLRASSLFMLLYSSVLMECNQEQWMLL